MRLAIIFWFAAAIACAGGVRADDASAKSPPDAFRQMCEKAMPDLLQGNPKGFEALKPACSSPQAEAFLKDVAYTFRTVFQRNRDDFGRPVDWKYLGAKRIGPGFRHDFYACRYSRRLYLWDFGAYEKDGRWSLVGLHGNTDAANLLDDLPADASKKDPACLKLCEEVLVPLVHAKGEAIDAIKRNVAEQDAAMLANLGEIRHACFADVSANGHLVKWDFAQARDLGGWLAEYCYTVEFDRGVRFARFVLYRPAKDWKLIGFSFNGDYDAMLAKTALELDASVSPASQTARATPGGPAAKPLLR